MTSVVDTSVKHFSSRQPGAPILTGQAGKLVAVLDACLVNGFGGKSVVSLVVDSGGVATITVADSHSAIVDSVILVSGVTNFTDLNGEQKVTAITTTTISFNTNLAAGTATGTILVKQAPIGWSIPFTGTNVRVYRSNDVTSNRRFVRIADTATYTSRIIVYENMTGISTGTGPMPTSAQLSGGGYIDKLVNPGDGNTAGVAAWQVFGDSKRIFISISGAEHYWGASYSGAPILGFGDFPSFKSGDVYNTFLAASNPNASNYSLGTLYSSNTSMWIQRLHTNAAGSVAMTKACGESSWLAGQGWLGPFPSPVGGQLLLEQSLLIAEPAATHGPRGMLPGLWQSRQTIPANQWAVGDIVVGAGQTAGRHLFAVAGGSHASASPPQSGSFFDITGPWE